MNDEIPVGLKTNQPMLEEFPAEADSKEDEKAPLTDRLQAKSWSLRAKAFDELAEILQNATEQGLDEVKEKWNKYLVESNPGVLEKVLLAFSIYVAKRDSIDECSQYLSILLEKSMACPKPAVKQKALDCALQICQKQNNPAVISKIISDSISKPWKVQISVSELAVKLIEDKGIDIPAVMALAEKMITGPNQLAHKQALIVYKDVYKRINTGITTYIAKLKQGLQDELKEAFKEITPKMSVQVAEVDVFLTASEVDYLSKYNEKWCEDYNGLDKWKEKKEKIDEALGSLPQGKPFKNTLQHCFFALLCKVIDKESNIVVVNTTIKLIARIAAGLRSKFSMWKQVAPILFNKFKEKKLEQDIFDCLLQMKWSIVIQELFDDIKSIISGEKSKILNPNIKKDVCIWISSQLQAQEKQIAEDEYITLSKMLIVATEDGSNDVRDASLAAMAIIRAKIPTAMEKLITNMLPQKKAKIMSIQSPQPSSEDVSKPTNLPGTAKKQPPTTVTESRSPQNDDQSLITKYIDTSVISLIQTGQWKEKVEAFKQLGELYNKLDPCLIKLLCTPLLVLLKKCLKEWKESNVNIVKSFLEFATILLSKEGNKEAYMILLDCYLEKAVEVKHKAQCDEGVMKLIELCGGKVICPKILSVVSAAKSPNNAKALLSLLAESIKAFSIKTFPIKQIIDVLKPMLVGAPLIKQGTTDVFKVLYSFIGPSLKQFLGDLKEQQMKNLETEFANIEVIKDASGQRKVKDESDSQKGDLMDSISPRVDISNQINQKVIQMMNDKDWKVRRDSINVIISIMAKANNRIEGNNLGNLFAGIKARLIDSNKAVQKGFISLLCKLAEAIGAKIKQYNKQVLPNLISVLSDKNNQLRGEVTIAITKLSEVIGNESIIFYMAPALQQDNPESRLAILQWIVKNCDSFKSCDMKVFTCSIIICLQDKSKQIRDLAEAIIPTVINSSNANVFQCALQDLKQAVKNTLIPIINKYTANKTEESAMEDASAIVNAEEPMQMVNEIEKAPAANSKIEVAPPANEILKEQSQNTPVIVFSPINSNEEKKANMTVNNTSSNKLADIPRPKQSIDLSNIRPIVMYLSKEKDKRAEIDKKLPWPTSDIKDENIETLKRTIKPHLNPVLIDSMFSPGNYKKHIECVQSLKGSLQAELTGIIDILDLLLKWISWRFVDGNPSLIKIMFEFLKDLVLCLEKINYTLYESEAQVLLTILGERTGNYSQYLRESSKELIMICPRIYSAVKIVPILTKTACTSRNMRSRYELFGIIKELMSIFTLEIISSKELCMIAKQLYSKDANIKGSVFALIEEAYKQIGSECWQYFAELEPNLKNEIVLKFPAISASITPNKISMTPLPLTDNKQTQKSPLIQAKPSIQAPSTIAVLDQKMPSPPYIQARPPIQSIAIPSTISIIDQKMSSAAQEFISQDIKLMPKLVISAEPINYDEIPNIIEKLDTDGLREVAPFLQYFQISSPKLEEIIIANISPLSKNVSTLLNSLQINSQTIADVQTGNLLSLLSAITNNKRICASITIDDFMMLTEAVLIKLLTEGLEKLSNDIMKKLNSNALRLLENCNTTFCICGLIRLLRLHRGNPERTKFRNLLIKCLLKLAKVMKMYIYTIDLSEIFIEIHYFVQYFQPISENISDNSEMKILKSIVFEATSIKLEKIVNDTAKLREITKNDAQPSTVLSWISSSITAIKSQPKIDQELKAIIYDLKVNGPIHCSSKLYEYMVKRPGFDLNSLLQNCSPKFAATVFNEIEKEKQRKVPVPTHM